MARLRSSGRPATTALGCRPPLAQGRHPEYGTHLRIPQAAPLLRLAQCSSLLFSDWVGEGIAYAPEQLLGITAVNDPNTAGSRCKGQVFERKIFGKIFGRDSTKRRPRRG